ncbi:hypothetical protein ACJX0J_033211, partial [Zea mays]
HVFTPSRNKDTATSFGVIVIVVVIIIIIIAESLEVACMWISCLFIDYYLIKIYMHVCAFLQTCEER